MHKFSAATALFFVFHSPFVFAHHVTTEFGNLESISANDYHFHLPVSLDMDGMISFGIDGITPEHEDPSEGSGVHIAVSPMVLFNREKVERNVCAEKVALSLSDLSVPLADHCSLLWNYKKRELDIGAGIGSHLGVGGVGLIPMKDTQIFQKRAVSRGQILDSKPRFPEEVADFSSWNVGDEIRYTRTLGLMIHSHIENPIPLLQIGPNAMFSTSWKISLEKASPTAVHVKAETSKLSEVGAEVGQALVNLGVGFGKTKSATFHFMINLNEADSNLAYQTLLLGHLEEAVQLSTRSNAIVNLGREQGKANVRSTVLAGGVPILFGARSSRGVMKAVSVDDDSHKMSSTLVFRERVTEGVLSRHKISGEYLAGSVEALQGDPFGHFGFVAFWSFEKEKLNDTRLERKVNGFLRDLGLAGKAKLILPDDADGYLRGETKVSFSSASLKSLVNMIQSEKEMEAFLVGSRMDIESRDAWMARWKRIAVKLRKNRKNGDTLAYSREITLLARELVGESQLFSSWIKTNGGVDVSVRVLGEKIPESTFKAPALDLI